MIFMLILRIIIPGAETIIYTIILNYPYAPGWEMIIALLSLACYLPIGCIIEFLLNHGQVTIEYIIYFYIE